MARIRSIKPDFWTDETLTECSLSSRLLFIGLWNFADDNGNLSRSAKKIKMQIFPGENFDCEPLIQELITHGRLIEYTVNEEKYLHIKNFRKHQVINRPSKSTIPEPDLTHTPAPLMESSLTEGKGREGKGYNTHTCVIGSGSDHGAHTHKSLKFPMRLDWKPDSQILEGVCFRAGVPPSVVSPALLANFSEYWSQESAANTETQWALKLLQFAQRNASQTASAKSTKTPYEILREGLDLMDSDHDQTA